MENFSAYFAILGSVFGAALGAFLHGYFSRKNQKDTRLDEWRNLAYSDFLNAVAAVAAAQRQGKRDEVTAQLGRLADAKSRICVYGDADVIEKVADFWRCGATLQTESELLAFTRVCLAIRKSTGADDISSSLDITQLLFGIDVGNVVVQNSARGEK